MCRATPTAARSASASRARRRRAAGVPFAVPSFLGGRGGGVTVVASAQVKVEKKDEGIEAMRKLMGGAADEDEEEGN